jgi:hypothetical protein
MNRVNSINQNGCSVCKAGEENYTTFRQTNRYDTVFYQYDYRHKDGELFSTVGQTWDRCREKRDKWLQKKNFVRLFPSTLQKIQDKKRLTKSEMGFQIGHIKPYHPISLYWDSYKREEVVKAFNRMFGTSIK